MSRFPIPRRTTAAIRRLAALVLIVSVLCAAPVRAHAGPPKGAAIEAGAPSSQSAPGEVPASTPAVVRRVFLPAASSAVYSSDQLILADVAAGRLDPQTGLIYQVYAAFRDPRLPGQYRGDDSAVVDSHALDQAMAQWEGLTGANREILRPFLTPPIYAGSWYDLRYGAGAAHDRAAAGAWVQNPPGTDLVPTATYPSCNDVDRAGWASDVGRVARIKVWWPAEKLELRDTAARFIAEMDATIWPKLTGLMGVPLDDSDAPCGGDDSRLDIYLAGVAGGTSTAPQLKPPGCKATPAYIMMQTASPDVLAHEFMHTIQWSYATNKACMYSTEEYAWLAEATAEWAMDYVYSDHNKEHESAPSFLSKTEERLKVWDRSHEYGAYLLPFFIARTQSAATIRTIWDNTRSMGALAAVDKALPGGFKGSWQQFARYNWNRAPYDLYKQWDGLSKGAVAKVDGTITPPALAVAYDAGPDRIKSLATDYRRFVFGASVRSVTFYNGFGFKVAPKELDFGGSGYAAEAATDEQKKGAMVEALIKINGAWRVEDWTGRDVVSFCRDKADERIQELVLIQANTAFDPADYELRAAGVTPKLVVSKIGCWQWKGSMHSEQVDENGSTWTMDATNLLWERTKPGVGIGVGYTLKQGTLDWRYEGTNCDDDFGSGTIPLAPVQPGDSASISSFNGIISGRVFGHLGAAIWNRTMLSYQECGKTITNPPPYNWGVMNPDQAGLNPDGKLQTTYDLGVEESPTWTWDLAPVAEP